VPRGAVGAGRGRHVRGSLHGRQPHVERRAAAGRAHDGDTTSTLGDDAVHHGQAEAGPLAGALGGEEGIEHPRPRRLVHARAGVGDGQQHVRSRLRAGRVRGRRIREHDGGRRDGETAARRHGVTHVDGEIHHHLLELAGIGLHPVQIGESGFYGRIPGTGGSRTPVVTGVFAVRCAHMGRSPMADPISVRRRG
jgi:hypothetical protein